MLAAHLTHRRNPDFVMMSAAAAAADDLTLRIQVAGPGDPIEHRGRVLSGLDQLSAAFDFF